MKNSNMLLQQLPTKIKGKKIRYDFRVMIAYERILKNKALSEAEKIKQAIALFFIDMPQSLEEAIEGLNWFYQCGKEKKDRGRQNNAPAYDFYSDDSMIYAAFYQDYGIKLDEAPLHWWAFSAMLEGLSENTLFKTAVKYRVADTSNMPPQMKEHYRKCKEIFAIERKEKPLTREQNFIQFVEQMRKRMEEAQKGGEQ